MSLDGGKYASSAVSRETLGDLSAPVVEQVEIAAKYSGYIDRQKDEVQRAAHLEKLRTEGAAVERDDRWSAR